MSRLSPKADVLRALFARSGNRCAFPGCTSPLINERNQFIAQVCHIEAAEEGGERFNPNQTDEERRQYENLLILCYPHHIETNDVASYPAQRLREIKAAHEHNFEKNPFKINESVLYKIALEMEQSGCWEAHAVVYPTSVVGSEWPVPTWNLRTSCQSVQAATHPYAIQYSRKQNP